MPQEVTKARVALIFKKGDTSKLDNYRPISLLNSVYKLLAAMIKHKTEEMLEHRIQQTQFGFRKHKGTRQAIQRVRRLAEMGEAADNQVIMVLLDWEKAFDKVTRPGLMSALHRLGTHPKFMNMIHCIYTNTQFCIEAEGSCSAWSTQHTGIRQGCPLSPYLFLCVMTVLFHDVGQRQDREL